MSSKYDYLIVGAGLFGSIFAREAADCGKRVLIVDKRPNIAGNIYIKNIAGIHYLVSATFTAYLFQEHNAIREALWRAVNIESYASGSVMLLLGRMCFTSLTLWGIGLVFYMLYILAKRVYLDKLCNTIVRTLESHLKI